MSSSETSVGGNVGAGRDFVGRDHDQRQQGGNASVTLALTERFVEQSRRGDNTVDNGLERLSREMQELTKAIYELKSEMALLKHRMEQLERSNGQNLLHPWQINAVMVALIAIAGLLMSGLYLLANGG